MLSSGSDREELLENSFLVALETSSFVTAARFHRLAVDLVQTVRRQECEDCQWLLMDPGIKKLKVSFQELHS